jgi:hypothetical protein
MRENQNPIRLNDRPLPEGHDEELLRLAHRLDVYRDPEQLMHAFQQSYSIYSTETA